MKAALMEFSGFLSADKVEEDKMEVDDETQETEEEKKEREEQLKV